MLVDLGIIVESVLSDVLSKFTDLPILQTDGFAESALFLEKLTPDFLLRHSFIPIEVNGDQIVLATSNPFNHEIFHGVSYTLGHTISLVVGGKTDIASQIRSLYQNQVNGTLGANGSDQSLETPENHLSKDEIERLRDMAADAPVVGLVNSILSDALLGKASDIHLEPSSKVYRIRFRTNGILNTYATRTALEYPAVASRIKILAGMDIAERRLPQDGRFRSIIRGKRVDIRASSVPTQHGESLVLRLLNVGDGVGSPEALGFDAMARGFIERMMARPHGIFLVTGPTGSGKTTTLYSALKLLNADTQKIITVEDPIEYEVEHVNQIQVNSDIGLTFAACLRSILRQDPDVLLIGEIRDSETAEIAVRAALTGHLVLATLHTNDALSAVSRLSDMGIEDYLISSTLNGILAQRLVRTLCNNCKMPTIVNDAMLHRILPRLPDLELSKVHNFHEANACKECLQSGYAGRTTICEYLEFGGENKVSEPNIMSAVGATKNRELIEMTMTACGLALAMEGTTSLEEVLRTTHV